MANVSCELRVYPNKELFAIDMAEIVDATAWGDHVIQGCTVSISENKLTITDGRILIGGRMAVVTGGDITNPTLSATDSDCHLVAYCDLQNTSEPFKIELLSSTDYATRISTGVSDRDDFNTESGRACLNLGTCTVDPATGYVSNWVLADSGKPFKGYDFTNKIEDAMTIKTGAFTICTDGIEVVAGENLLRKQMGIVECKIRFKAVSNYLTINKLILMIPEGFRPLTVVRAIAIDWRDSSKNYRINIFSNGRVELAEAMANGTWIILTVHYMTSFDPVITP